MTRADLPEGLRGKLAASIAETGRLASVSPDTIRGEIARGRLRAVQVGGGQERASFIIPIDALLDWLNGTAREPEPAPAGKGRR